VRGRLGGPAAVLVVLFAVLGASRCTGEVADYGHIKDPDSRDDRRGQEELKRRLSE